MWKRNVALALLIACSPIPTFAAQHGNWHSDVAHGYERYWTQNSKGDRFTIWCPPSHKPGDALISVNIHGSASPQSLVRIQLDRKQVKFKTDSKGFIRNNCAACVDNLTYFWHQLRSSKKFAVQLEDKRFAGFSLDGIQEAIPSSVCSSRMAGQSR
ncbi:MAG: hypothetical protein JJ979_25660 [Roseibium sp.]|nr:hypothetical protein [Roseibium sp.]